MDEEIEAALMRAGAQIEALQAELRALRAEFASLAAERERCAVQLERLGQHELAQCLRTYRD